MTNAPAVRSRAWRPSGTPWPGSDPIILAIVIIDIEPGRMARYPRGVGQGGYRVSYGMSF